MSSCVGSQAAHFETFSGEHNICSICENICSFIHLICPSSPLSSFLICLCLSPPVRPPFCRGPPGEEVSLRARAPHTGFTGRPERACNKDWLQHSPWQLELRWGDPARGCHSSQVNDNRIMCDCTDNCATYTTRHHKRFNQGLTCRNTAFGTYNVDTPSETQMITRWVSNSEDHLQGENPTRG